LIERTVDRICQYIYHLCIIIVQGDFLVKHALYHFDNERELPLHYLLMSRMSVKFCVIHKMIETVLDTIDEKVYDGCALNYAVSTKNASL